MKKILSYIIGVLLTFKEICHENSKLLLLSVIFFFSLVILEFDGEPSHKSPHQLDPYHLSLT